jgi:hypothetical protein
MPFVAAGPGSRHGAGHLFGAGLLLVARIGLGPSFIQVYSWFHATHLATATVVLGFRLADDPDGIGCPRRRRAAQRHLPPGPTNDSPKLHGM